MGEWTKIGVSECGEYHLYEYSDDFGELYNCCKVTDSIKSGIGGYPNLHSLEKLKGFSFKLDEVSE